MNGREKLSDCALCGRKSARTRHVSRSYGVGRNLLVIEGVPVVSCGHCGASYLIASTLHVLEVLKRKRRALATRRAVGVLRFAQ